jgi:hypothetical protein
MFIFVFCGVMRPRYRPDGNTDIPFLERVRDGGEERGLGGEGGGVGTGAMVRLTRGGAGVKGGRGGVGEVG